MNIAEVVKKALPEHRGIRRRLWKEAGMPWYIIPTNSLPCLIIKMLHNGNGYPHWNPTAEDLTAEDWETIEDGGLINAGNIS